MANALSMPPPPAIGDRVTAAATLPSQSPGQPVAPQPAPPPPPPSHQQTVAALRHFGAIKRELLTLLNNPDVGKANMKSAIIDGTTNLVKDGILTAGQAITQLATVPQDDPFQQKKWLEQQLTTTVEGANAVLDHHRAAFAGMPVDETVPPQDTHTDVISALTKSYGRANAR